MNKKVVPKLQQKVKVDIVVTSDEIKIHYIGKFQDFTARYIINYFSFDCPVSAQLDCRHQCQNSPIILSSKSYKFKTTTTSDWLNQLV